MESITLRELAAYLPYEVRYKDSYAGDISTRILNGNSIEHWKCGHIKPLILQLRPISQITKKIKVNGCMFVPIDYFVGYDVDLILNAVQFKDLSYISYNLVQKLLEWHFDCFNLIDKSLASAIDLDDI